MVECPVCLKNTTCNTRLQCGHLFCLKCIAKWSNKSNNCPMCRSPYCKSEIRSEHRLLHMDKGLSRLASLIGL